MSNHAYEAAETLMKPSRLVSPGTDFDGAEFPPSQHNIEMAKVWAAMAIAYEQRTANLMAFERSQWEAWKANDLTDDGQRLWEKAAEQIAERLGLE